MSYDREEKSKKHESFGQVGISRISGIGHQLHGSDVTHDAWLRLTVWHGSMQRSLNQEWYHTDEEIIEIELSHSQFSEMISNMNTGSGVPCTISTLNGKRMEQPPPIDRSGQYKQEFRKDLQEISIKMNKAIEAAESLLKKSGATKSEKQIIVDLLKSTKQDIGFDLPFVEKQFGECIDKAVDDAKRNIEGHALNKVMMSAQKQFVQIDNDGNHDSIRDMN